MSNIPDASEEDDNLKIFVSRLPSAWKEHHLKEHFDAIFGNVSSVYIKKDSDGNSLKFGFVTFSSQESRQAALQQESMHVKKRTIQIKEVVRDEDAAGRGRDIGVCFAWKKFNCVKGESCKFLHDGIGGCRVVPEKGCGKGKKCLSFKSKGKCSKGDSCPFVHENKQQTMKKRVFTDYEATSIKICHTFVKKGKCRKGDSCPFAHTGRTEEVPLEQQDQSGQKKRRINGEVLVQIRSNRENML